MSERPGNRALVDRDDFSPVGGWVAEPESEPVRNRAFGEGHILSAANATNRENAAEYPLDNEANEKSSDG